MTGRVVLVLITEGLVAVAVFFGVLVYRGFGTPPDPQRVCGVARHHSCMTSEPALVDYIDRDERSAQVSYADGVRWTALTMRDLPGRQHLRVALERWDGKVVSLWDPVSERRYRTIQWPVRWSADSFAGPFIGLVFFLAAAGGLAALVVAHERARRR